MATPRPDPSTPTGVAAATFPTVRKGADPDAVRAFLREVADRMSQLQRDNDDLHRQLTEAQSAERAPDAAQMAHYLGDETARIVQAAREAADEIRQKAEESAAQLVRDASDEIARTRTHTEHELARLRAQANSEALATTDAARDEGRAMVAEAREYREKVLADVNRRRDLARQQLGDVEAGRLRLVHVFEQARTAAHSVLEDLGSAVNDEPDDFVDLSPTTGPVPLIVPGMPPPDVAPVAEEAGADDAPVADVIPIDGEARGGHETVEITDVIVIEETDDGVDITEIMIVEETADVPGVDETAAGDEPVVDDAGTVVGLYAGELESPLAAELAAQDTDRASVDDLFAKLRRASAEMVARDVSEATPTEPDEPAATAGNGPFGVRDEVLVPLIVASARKVKRVLADEQNEVLDRLRRNQGGDTLPAAEEHADRYSAAIAPEVREALASGASSVGGSAPHDAEALARVDEAVRDGIVDPLRDRLQRAIDQAGADTNELASLVRAVYREWKSSRIDDQMDGVMRLAFDEGAYAAVAPGTPVEWVLDPQSGACGPDCEDNSLGGAVAAGEPFPTGHLHPPLHGGCRCLLQIA